jgi:hypothetical protein
MPLVCTGTYRGVLGEYPRERIAHALQHVEPVGPYQRADALALFVYNGTAMRCDVVVENGAAVATIARKGGPQRRHAPIPVDDDADVVAIARMVFAAGLPQWAALPSSKISD